MKTICVSISPAKMQDLFDAIELPWQLVCVDADGSNKTVFTIFIDGAETVHQVILNDDGTWTATTHITP